MKLKAFFLFFFISINIITYSQVEQTNFYRNLYNTEKYDEIINHKLKKGEELTAKSLYYIGMAHYMKNNDSKALKYLTKALEKGPVDFDMFYYKGITLFYLERYEESLPYFDSAIVRLPMEPDFYTGKGEVYYTLNKYDSAYVYFKKGIALPNCKPRFYILMGSVCQQLKLNSESLTAYKAGLSKIGSGDENYQICLYNIGLLELLHGDSILAIETLEKYNAKYLNDYPAIAKLIQAYYKVGKFEEAKTYKKILYEAHKKKKLPAEMKEMFCFDQFIWKGKRVMVYENFDEPDEFLFVKHKFYVMNENGKVDFLIRSESSVAVRMTPGNKYVLCLVEGNSYQTYWNYIFNDNYSYPVLKAAVLKILNKEVEPSGKTIIEK